MYFCLSVNTQKLSVNTQKPSFSLPDRSVPKTFVLLPEILSSCACSLL